MKLIEHNAYDASVIMAREASAKKRNATQKDAENVVQVKAARREAKKTLIERKRREKVKQRRQKAAKNKKQPKKGRKQELGSESDESSSSSDSDGSDGDGDSSQESGGEGVHMAMFEAHSSKTARYIRYGCRSSV